MDSDTANVARIQEYAKAVDAGDIRCPVTVCPHCRRKVDHFGCHQRRNRGFRALVRRFVRAVASRAVRWRCPHCGKTFTTYPDFALPFKRYSRQAVLEMTGRYQGDDDIGYREAAGRDGLPVFYEGRTPREIDYRALCHSTVWRWMTSLSRYAPIVQKALGLIRAKSSTSPVFRDPLVVHPRKYRSEQRKGILKCVLRLFQVEAAYRGVFHESIFLHLAPSCGWGHKGIHRRHERTSVDSP